MFESRRPDTAHNPPSPGSGSTLYVGTRAASSWSLRAWLALDLARRPLEVVEIDLYQPDRASRIRPISPSGKVPVLVSGNAVIWDSLAIMEWAAEFAPELWPSHARRRAVARSVVAEMHSGFPALRSTLPMDWFARYPLRQPLPEAVRADIQRITGLWRELLEQSGRTGYLFGSTPTLADVAYVPVASRFVTYGLVPHDPTLEGYVDRLVNLSNLTRWFRDVAALPVLPSPPPIVAETQSSVAPPSVPLAAAAPTAPTADRLGRLIARAQGRRTDIRSTTPNLATAPVPTEDAPSVADTGLPSLPADEPPPFPQRRAAATEEVLPQDKPETSDDEPRSEGLPWLRRRNAQPTPASIHTRRRRPPPRD
ncbi:MAG: glutathione S-transferase [Geminicoccaceae bacterium]|nr:MAG: glutathione S-transferase [Geminicoccaceae bacterium]